MWHSSGKTFRNIGLLCPFLSGLISPWTWCWGRNRQWELNTKNALEGGQRLRQEGITKADKKFQKLLWPQGQSTTRCDPHTHLSSSLLGLSAAPSRCIPDICHPRPARGPEWRSVPWRSSQHHCVQITTWPTQVLWPHKGALPLHAVCLSLGTLSCPQPRNARLCFPVARVLLFGLPGRPRELVVEKRGVVRLSS